jgi:dTDP-4-amino-4,6-dideoxygalactose transaminase
MGTLSPGRKGVRVGSQRKVRRLPPAGERVSSTVAGGDQSLFPSHEAILLNSGTAALYLAMETAKRMQNTGSKEVVVSAYTCPDIIAAAVKSGLQVKLVDTTPNSFRIDRRLLVDAINERTLAVVAQHFLGMAEDIAAIKRVCEQQQVILLEDSAQRWPADPSDSKET